MLEKTFTIIDESGIHARPASALVKAASDFGSEIKLGHKGKEVNLKSIMGVMSLGIAKDAQIKVITEGEDEEQALRALEEALQKERLILQ